MVKNWMQKTMLLAGIYNLLWGAWTIFFPAQLFELTGAEIPKYLEIWQCVGMIVGVYGLGYLAAVKNPIKHWPIVMVGFLGKVFGPIGFIGALVNQVFPPVFGVTIIFNDLIWWIPFFLILKATYERYFRGSTETRSFSLEEVQAMEQRDRARLINSLSGIKSANLIGTTSEDGKNNLCIVSSVFHLGANPALIGFIHRPDTVERHTLENIRSTKVFTINHVNEKIYRQAHQTSARYPREKSEFEACGLTEQTLFDFKAPFVGESKIKMAVELVREVPVEENGTHFMIGKIVNIQVPTDCLRDDFSIDITRATSVGVAGLDEYLEANPLERLSYAKPDQELQSL